jgi:hypothetical protein
MELIEKDFLVSGHKIGTFYAYSDIDSELVPTYKGEKVIPAPYFFERNNGNFTLVKRYEPGSKIGWPLGGYEVSDGTGARRAFDLDQVICAPTTPYQQMVVEKMKVKSIKSAQTDEACDPSAVEIVEGEDAEVKELTIEDFEPKAPGKRGRPALDPAEKARREQEKLERAQRSGGKRGRPAMSEAEKARRAAEKEDVPNSDEPKVPGRRGRPALSEEEKAKREQEKAARAAISGGKRGRPRKNPTFTE